MTEVSIVAIWPIWVSMPVAVTTIVAGAAGDRGVLEQHVRPVAERDVRAGEHAASLATGALSPVSAASCVSSVAERTIRPSAGTMSPASTLDDVAGHDLDRRHEHERAVAEHLGLRHLQVRERVDARPRLQLLPGPEHDVEQDQQRDDDAGGDLADREAHHRDRDRA